MGRSHGYKLAQLHKAASAVLARAPTWRYCNIRTAVAALGTAIAAEFPKRHRERGVGVRRATKFYDPRDAARIYRRRNVVLKAERHRLAAELAKHKSARSQDGMLSEEWIQRVICCVPHTSGHPPILLAPKSW